MSYSMHVEDSAFSIKRENVRPAREALKALMEPGVRETMMRKYHPHAFAGGYAPQHYYGIEEAKLAESKSLRQAVDAFGWTVEVDEDSGDVTEIECGGYLGEDDLLFDTLGPFVEAGSFIEMRGEDGERWKWVFDGTRCKHLKGKFTWDE